MLTLDLTAEQVLRHSETFPHGHEGLPKADHASNSTRASRRLQHHQATRRKRKASSILQLGTA